MPPLKQQFSASPDTRIFRLRRNAFLGLPFLVIAFHTIVSPYTKVEESFTLHAVRDILVHGIRPEAVKHYDHLPHPGPLPRSFIPPLIIAAGSKPWLWIADIVAPGRNPLVDQVIVRLVLGFINAASLSHLGATIRSTFGPTQAVFFVLLSVTQFHACYWAGRTVPNMLALSAATIALSMLLQALRPTSIASENTKRKESKFIYAIVLLATAASIVRAEVALLLVGVVALVFYKESTAPSNAGTSVAGDKNTLPATRKYRLTLLAVRTTIVAGILGAAMSLAVDSYFWSAWLADYRQQEQQLAVNNNSSGQNAGMLQHLLKVVGFGTYWIWPEAWGLLFNVVEGKSSMWGTSPWYAYLLLHLPKLLLASLPLVIFPALVDSSVSSAAKGWKALLLFPPAVLVLGMSMLGHKEWRFIVYVVPWLNTIAALISAQIWNGRHTHRPTILSRFLLLALIGGLIGNTVVTLGLAYVSHHNYPGGKAMDLLHQVHQERFVGLEGEKSVANEAVRIFLPPGPRMTGASAYTFRYAPPSGHWEYNTTESLSTDFGAPEQLWKDGFDYVVTSMDEAESFIAPSDEGKARWALLRSVDAFGGVQRRKGLVPLKVRWKREIGILGRN